MTFIGKFLHCTYGSSERSSHWIAGNLWITKPTLWEQTIMNFHMSFTTCSHETPNDPPWFLLMIEHGFMTEHHVPGLWNSWQIFGHFLMLLSLCLTMNSQHFILNNGLPGTEKELTNLQLADTVLLLHST
jgi:hypothetical protein